MLISKSYAKFYNVIDEYDDHKYELNLRQSINNAYTLPFGSGFLVTH